jgi:hypothetical protein
VGPTWRVRRSTGSDFDELKRQRILAQYKTPAPMLPNVLPARGPL